MMNGGFTENELTQLNEIIGNRTYMKNAVIIGNKILVKYDNGFSSCNFEDCNIEIQDKRN